MKEIQAQNAPSPRRIAWIAIFVSLAMITATTAWIITKESKDETGSGSGATAAGESIPILTSKLTPLTTKRDELLKNFLHTGDKFKYPKIYSHTKNGLQLFSVTADGLLYQNSSYTKFTLLSEGENFRIEFTHITNHYYGKNKVDYADLSDGMIAYSVPDSRDRKIFKNLDEFCSYMLSEKGKSLRRIEVKKQSIFKDVYDREIIIEGEDLIALRDTIELFLVLKEIEKLNSEIKQSWKK